MAKKTKVTKNQAPAPTVVDAAEMALINRIQKCEDFSTGRSVGNSFTTANRKTPSPVEPSYGSRGTLKATWKPMADRIEKDAAKVIEPKAASSKLEKNAEYIGTYHNYNGVINPEYDLMEPFVIYDTEVFVKQAINRRLALMFRNGFEIVSHLDSDLDQSQKNVDYINKRFDVMEYVSNRSTETFFRDLLFNLLLCSNCFLRKIRDEKASAGVSSDKNNDKQPVAAYTIIPAHEIKPVLKKGRIDKWRRYFQSGAPYEDIPTDEILHLKWDVKPGHIFGTPRTVGVRDDIFALRRLEENIELLFINFLFPLFHVKVGTEKNPAWYGPNGETEVDIIRYQIETMPKEGVFVTDERVVVDTVGAQGQSLDTEELIKHLKGRVFTGMGVSPLDMGEGDTANRSTADNISQNLKDAIKADSELFANLIRMHMFKEWFMEANYSVSIQKAVSTTMLVFHEIDLDNLIKEQNHITQLWLNNLISNEEARKALKKKPMDAKTWKDSFFEKVTWPQIKRTSELQHEQAKELAEQATSLEKELLTHQTKEGAKQAETTMALNQSEMQKHTHIAKAAHIKANAQVKVLKAKTAHAMVAGPTVGKKKSVQNKETPTNQHGRNTGPTKAKSSRELREALYDGLVSARSTMSAGNIDHLDEWKKLSDEVVDRVFIENNAVETILGDEKSYTNQSRMDKERLKALIASNSDLEIINVLLDSAFYEGEDDNPEMEPDSEDSTGESATD
jgi:hypothetical protein